MEDKKEVLEVKSEITVVKEKEEEKEETEK